MSRRSPSSAGALGQLEASRNDVARYPLDMHRADAGLSYHVFQPRMHARQRRQQPCCSCTLPPACRRSQVMRSSCSRW
ncbi:hypothetical protein [Massilia oculi]|uniref:hypothetical protein n=1 Tax=Massilia oculi TaxID=945844 RepID=UPI0028AB07B3|nr:hypothetical protein [Massilia oculi]